MYLFNLCFTFGGYLVPRDGTAGENHFSRGAVLDDSLMFLLKITAQHHGVAHIANCEGVQKLFPSYFKSEDSTSLCFYLCARDSFEFAGLRCEWWITNFLIKFGAYYRRRGSCVHKCQCFYDSNFDGNAVIVSGPNGVGVCA